MNCYDTHEPKFALLPQKCGENFTSAVESSARKRLIKK